MLKKYLSRLCPLHLVENSDKKILVIAYEMYVRGGLLRFERMGKILRDMGYQVVFCTVSGKMNQEWKGFLPVIDVTEALHQRWDITMLPGRAGFYFDENRNPLNLFIDERFGLRVQHILNDKNFAKMFIALNKNFLPHIVIFNNHCWKPVDFSAFIGNEFHYVLGGVDCNRFNVISKPAAPPNAPCIIGGQLRKNPQPLIESLYHLPNSYSLVLFGPYPMSFKNCYEDLLDTGRLKLVGILSEDELLSFYASIDLVVSTEIVAGWSNLAAEAMASGIPLICTTAGTQAMAVHGETSIMINDLSPASLSTTIRQVWTDKALRKRLVSAARQRIQVFDWLNYSKEILKVMEGGRTPHYYYAPQYGLYGKWPIETRLQGLTNILSQVREKTVLDLGTAEGLIAKACLESGALLVHGVEVDEERIRQAISTCQQESNRVHFYVSDLNEVPGIFNQDVLMNRYDVVLYLGVHQHLSKSSRLSVIREAASRCSDILVIRMPEEIFEMDVLDKFLKRQEFFLDYRHPGSSDRTIGPIWIYRRTKEKTLRAAAHLQAVEDFRINVHTESPAVVSNSVKTRHFISYPKSGRTWIRYVLHKLGVAGAVQFYHDGFEFNDGTKPPHNFDIESRRLRYSAIDRIVYLRRDPRDIMASLYYQITGRFRDFFHFEGSISDFIRDDYFGAKALANFRSIWDELIQSPHILTIDYEECHHDMAAVISRILRHFDFKVSPYAIYHAVYEASFDRMKKMEETNSFPCPWLRKRNDMPKVRKGKVGGHTEEFSRTDIDYLNDIFNL